eukprot:87240-Amphidinium_carterae.1
MLWRVYQDPCHLSACPQRPPPIKNYHHAQLLAGLGYFCVIGRKEATGANKKTTKHGTRARTDVRLTNTKENT